MSEHNRQFVDDHFCGPASDTSAEWPESRKPKAATVSVAAELDRLFPAADQLNRFQDLREQTKRFAATLLATVPPGQQREDALQFLRRSVTAAVLGIRMRGQR